MKRLDEDLNQFAEDLKQEGKILEYEPSILPPLPLVIREEKRKRGYIAPQLKRIRKKNMDLKLMPPPRSHKKSVVAAVDAYEPTYCVCNQVSYGEMIACDNENCEAGEWFHYSCVGLIPGTRFKSKWFCPICRQQK